MFVILGNGHDDFNLVFWILKFSFMFLVLVFFFCYNTDYSILFHYGIDFSKFSKTTYGILESSELL